MEEFDHEKQRKIYQEMAKIIYDDQPYTFLYNRSILWGVNRRIRGVTCSPRGVFGFEPSGKAWWMALAEKP